MIEELHIIDTQSRNAAVIHLSMPRERIKVEMAPAIQEVLAAISSQGLAPAGPLFVHHLKLSSNEFDFEVGFPVNHPITPAGRVKPGTLPAAKVARTVYRGDYEGLYAAWHEFGKRLQSEGILAREGLTQSETLWETYVAGPETSGDPRDWITELNLPLRIKKAA